MPKYMALIYGTEPDAATAQEWGRQMMEEYQHFNEVAGAAGVMAGGEALEPAKTATTVQVRGGAKGGDVVLTDGPFAETKEVLGGFYLLECGDLDEAITWAQQIPGAWQGGRVEVRPCVDFTQGG